VSCSGLYTLLIFELLHLLVVMACKYPIIPVFAPNPVYNHSKHVTFNVRSDWIVDRIRQSRQSLDNSISRNTEPSLDDFMQRQRKLAV
jgi:hypothetical protein